MQVVFVLSGAANMGIKRFLVYDFIASTLWLGLFFWMGWSLGEPAVEVLNWYARIAGYVAVGLLVVIVGGTMLKAKKDAAASTKTAE